MQKVIFILTGRPGENYPAFGQKVFNISEKLVQECDPKALKVTLTERKPPLLSVIPFRRSKVAVISTYGSSQKMHDMVGESEGFTGGYQVEEAIPLAYEKHWEDRTPTPGICLLTLFHKKPGLEQGLFIRRWHEGHTPLSLELHPLWNYNRNVVREVAVKDSPWFDGIVEEQFRTAQDLLNPLKFFGPPLKVPAHMIEVYRDTRSFIDMKRIETYLATEYHLRS